MDTFLKLAGLAIARAVYLLLFKLCGILGVTASPDDLTKASTWAAGVLAILVGGAVEYYFPKFWAWFRPKAQAVPGLLMVAAILGAAALFGLAGCSAFAPPTPITQQDLILSQANDLEFAYQIGVAEAAKAHKDGKISDQTMRTVVVPIEQTVYDYLQAAKDAALKGDTVSFATQQKLFKDALAKMTAAALGVDITTPATRPE